MERKINKQVRGFKTQDGAGVNLVRVLGHGTTEEFDPILMLDSFDSSNPNDYVAGFPMHPHRGIETISYIYKGKMVHKDSLGNEDMISDGEVQWMTAGSGIMHEEKLPASTRMLGVQLWLNLPKKDKMTQPSYRSIKNADIKEIALGKGKLRLLAGKYKDNQGYNSEYLPLDYYDIHLNENSSFVIDTEIDKSIMLFTLIGEISIGGETIREKTAAKLTNGTSVEIKTMDKRAQILYISSTRLNEAIAWGGPIVMNTDEELENAFKDLRRGTFLQQGMSYNEE